MVASCHSFNLVFSLSLGGLMRKVYLCERCDKSYSCVTRRDVESPFYTNELTNRKEITYASSEEETSTVKVFTAGRLPFFDGYIIPSSITKPCYFVSKYNGNIDFMWYPTQQTYQGDNQLVESVSSCHATHRIKVGDRYFHRVSIPLCVMSDLYHICQTGSMFECVVRDIVAGLYNTPWSEVLRLYYLPDTEYQNKSLSFWIPVEFMKDPLWDDGMLAIETTDLNTYVSKEHLIPLTLSGYYSFNGIPCACFKLGEALMDNFKWVVRTDTRERIPSFVRFNHQHSEDVSPGIYGYQHEVVARTFDELEDTYVSFFEKFGEHDPNFYVWTDALVEKTPIYIRGSAEYEGVYFPKESFEEPLALNYPDERIGSVFSQWGYGDAEFLGIYESEFTYVSHDGTFGNEWIAMRLINYSGSLFVKKPDFILAYEKKAQS